MQILLAGGTAWMGSRTYYGMVTATAPEMLHNLPLWKEFLGLLGVL